MKIAVGNDHRGVAVKHRLVGLLKELGHEVALCGPADRIKGMLDRWIDAGKKHHVGSMNLGAGQPEALRIVAEAVL